MCLALIVVLVIIVIGVVVYYRGLLWFGPYVKGGAKTKGRKKFGSGRGDAEAQGDDETERLIDTINRH